VYWTIDKFYIVTKVLNEQKESKEINQKGSLKHLKRSAPEVKCSRRQSAPGVMTSSEAASSEATFHQMFNVVPQILTRVPLLNFIL